MDKMTLLQIQQALTPVFQKHGVSFAYLFGSRARGEATENSDYDIALYFLDGYKETFQLSVDITKVLQAQIDIVVLNTVQNEVLKYGVFTEGALLYEKNKNKRLEKELSLITQAKSYMEQYYGNIIRKFA